jgi:hypothetical protein
MGLDPSASLEPMQRRIQRSLLNTQDVVRDLLHSLRDSPAMLGSEGKSAQDEQVQSSLRKVNAGGRHPYPFHFYRGGYSDSGRSARSKTGSASIRTGWSRVHLPSPGLCKVFELGIDRANENRSGASVLKNSRQHGQDKHRRGPSTPRHKRCVTRSICEALRSG